MKKNIFERLTRIIKTLEEFSKDFLDMNQENIDSIYEPISLCIDEYKELCNMAEDNHIDSDNEYKELTKKYNSAIKSLYIKALIVVNTD